MRLQVALSAATGGLLLGFLVYCSPSSPTLAPDTDGGVGVCDPDAGPTNCPCDPSKFKLPVTCYTGPKGTSGKGVCAAGQRTCSPDGITSDCVGQVGPTAEVCDYLDNDCNGIVDDVQGTSARLPDAGGADIIDLCQAPGCDPTFTDAGIGCYSGTVRNVCKAGSRVCGAGRQLTCLAFTGIVPQPEVCNGWDDDCNDLVDDGLDNLGACDVDPDAGFTGADGGIIAGECVHGTGHCADGGQYCPPSDPAAEKCDGKDNDCNTLIDDHACKNGFGYDYCCHSGSYYVCGTQQYITYGYQCVLAK